MPSPGSPKRCHSRQILQLFFATPMPPYRSLPVLALGSYCRIKANNTFACLPNSDLARSLTEHFVIKTMGRNFIINHGVSFVHINAQLRFRQATAIETSRQIFHKGSAIRLFFGLPTFVYLPDLFCCQDSPIPWGIDDSVPMTPSKVPGIRIVSGRPDGVDGPFFPKAFALC
jgi:hypothetical protein